MYKEFNDYHPSESLDTIFNGNLPQGKEALIPLFCRCSGRLMISYKMNNMIHYECEQYEYKGCSNNGVIVNGEFEENLKDEDDDTDE